jgi:hypothetical protein
MSLQSPVEKGSWHGIQRIIYIYIFTLWLFNIAMENGPVIDGLPFLNMGGFSMAMLVITRWYIYIYYIEHIVI